MPTVTSKDGTTITFDHYGTGPAVIIIDGALQYRAFDQGSARLAELLAQHFTAIHYDRRGRGDSTDTLPFAVDREIDDIAALIDYTGGAAFAYGISSGAALAFEAALALGPKVAKLAMYEAPYNDDATARQSWRAYRTQLADLLANGHNGDAVILFMRLVGLPDEHVPAMRHDPSWPLFESIASTLAYDAAALGDEAALPAERAANITVPTFVMDGEASYPFMHSAAVALAHAIPHGQHRTLEGATHDVPAEAIAPVLVEFFGS